MADKVTSYRFGGGCAEMGAADKDLLGGKGANLCEMDRMGLPVPPGVVIPTTACKKYRKITSEKKKSIYVQELVDQFVEQVPWLEQKLGVDRPLVSVRSGAPVSMPGMMETVLNVGLNHKTADAWAERIGDRAAVDSFRRLVQMLGTTAFGLRPEVFEDTLRQQREIEGVETDAELSLPTMHIVLAKFEEDFNYLTGQEFPESTEYQLFHAIKAVLDSWDCERAKHYRKMHGIDESMGTAVVIQSMVFGNMGDDSGTAVLFTRNPLTGGNEMFGEFLRNAQGEDVVAGTRTPLPIGQLGELGVDAGVDWTVVMGQLEKLCAGLEAAYTDMLDLEVTIQQGTVWMLQCRVGKRSALAEFKIAHDMLEEGLIEKKDLPRRISKAAYRMIDSTIVDPAFDGESWDYVGTPGCPGAAKGRAVKTAAEAVEARKKGELVILVTEETTPDDIAGMEAAAGIVTRTGGTTSHAAVVARGMNRPCVVGVSDLDHESWGAMTEVTLDGGTGRVWIDKEVPVVSVAGKKEVAAVEAVLLDRAGVIPVLDMPKGEGEFCLSLAEIGCEKMILLLDSAPEQLARTHLDLRTEKELLPKADVECLEWMGQWDNVLTEGEALKVAKHLAEYADDCKYVRVVHPGSDVKVRIVLENAGFVLPKEPKTIAELMGGKRVLVTKHMIDNVFGSQEALDKVMGLLGDDAPEIVREAVPARSAVFTFLKG